MKRRDFLRLAGTAGLATALPGLAMRPAFAETQAEPFGGLALITIFAGGGWDHSSFADPRENTAINHWAFDAPAGTAGNLRNAPIAESRSSIAPAPTAACSSAWSMWCPSPWTTSIWPATATAASPTCTAS